MKYPQRPKSHDLEELSKRFFAKSLPPDWVPTEQKSDYGVDMKVEIFINGQATGLEFLVQLKSSEKASEKETEPITVRIATYNYLWDKLQVVIFMKYIKEVDEAYYLLFKDIPEPNQEQETFTVHIPKAHKLSGLDWDEFQKYILMVQEYKLKARPARPQ